MVLEPRQRPSRLRAAGRSSGADRSLMIIWAAGDRAGAQRRGPLSDLCAAQATPPHRPSTDWSPGHAPRHPLPLTDPPPPPRGPRPEWQPRASAWIPAQAASPAPPSAQAAGSGPQQHPTWPYLALRA